MVVKEDWDSCMTKRDAKSITNLHSHEHYSLAEINPLNALAQRKTENSNILNIKDDASKCEECDIVNFRESRR